MENLLTELLSKKKQFHISNKQQDKMNISTSKWMNWAYQVIIRPSEKPTNQLTKQTNKQKQK